MVRDERNGIDPGVLHGGRAMKHLVLAATAAAMLAAGAARADDATPTPTPTPPAAAPAAPAPAVAAPATPADGTPAAATPAAPEDPVVAQRGDVKLTASAVRNLIRYSDPDQRHLLETNPTALLQAVRDRLLKLSLVRQAESKGWDKRDDVVYRLKLARDEVIAGSWVLGQVPDDPNFPSDAQIQAAYEANKSKLMLPRQYHIAQIYLPLPRDASKQTDDDDQRKLADLRQQLTKQHADFAALAKRYSEDKGSGPNGGDLGWVRDDAMVAPVRAAVEGLAEGGISQPVRGPSGWHLVKLIAVKAPSQATLDEARDALARAMRQERVNDWQRNYISAMIKQQPIEVNEVELNKLAAK
jgi:peptidylprolyl isomerase